MATRSANSPTCDDDASRLAALHRYGILDTPPEPAFDDLTRLAAHVCQAPVAVINLIDRDRQWFKSEIGLGVRQTPLDVSICAHAILQRDLFVVPDTLLDDRFKHNPLVTGKPHLRFYAGALLETADGHPLGTLCVLDHVPRDLAGPQREALRMLARQVMGQLDLRRARDAAEAANRAKDRFLAFLAHELRGPLTPALLAADAMAGDAAMPDAARADAAVIRRNIELATRLADDLLDANRIALGKLDLRSEPADVHELLRAAAAMCGAEASAKGVRLALDLRAARHAAVADPARLTQVWTNLLKNAVKFTPAGGSVTVRTSDAGGGRLRVDVADTGVGVDPALLARMFRLYEQGDQSVARGQAGLGLGLAICKGIVDAHGGTITAASPGRGHGTMVTVELATSADDAGVPAGHPVPVRAPARVAGAEPPPGLKILLVDDHEDTLRMMSRLLGGLRHQVTTATSVVAALAAAERDEYDLLISDVGLGDGSGLDLMRELLKRGPVRGIALTGYGTAEDVRQTREAGFAAHLTKPVDFARLCALIPPGSS